MSQITRIERVRRIAGRDGATLLTLGRDAAGRYTQLWRALVVTVTARGHWYRSDDAMDAASNDRLCRGCGYHGHFDYILDQRLCSRPASAAELAAALTGGAA